MTTFQKVLFPAIFGLAYAALLIAAWFGVDFSPSFTAIFLFVCYALIVCGEGVAIINPRGKTLLRLVCTVFSILGIAFVFPSVYIYAVGDDWLNVDCWIAAAGAVVLTAFISYLQWKKREKKVLPYLSERLELLLYTAATAFTLACAVTSPALWPYGLGLALFTGSRCFKNKLVRNILVCSGILLSAAFLWSPMIF